jgi:hypothetical protein
MKKTILLLCPLAFLLVLSCTRPESAEQTEITKSQLTSTEITAAFIVNYIPYCGNVYSGRSVFVDLGEDSPLLDAELTMTLSECSESEVRIPFYVDEDQSRTWILSMQDGALRLEHDHRYEDGSEYEANFYGGFAMDNENTHFEHYPEYAISSETILFFPSDDRTIADRPARNINVWSKEFDLENQRYYYRLYLEGRLRYEAEFDLSQVISE